MPTPQSVTSKEIQTASAETTSRNFLLLAIHQAVMRTGWIFKTESIVMPAVLDTLGGGAWLRGCLPMLNRLGQSVPPLFFAEWVRRLLRKRLFLAVCSIAMGVAFLLMAVAWQQLDPAFPITLTWIFISLYTAFFVAVGLHQVALGMLSAKLVKVNRRGALMTRASLVGGLAAILCAWFLLWPWMSAGRSHFVHIFIFAGLMFIFAAVVVIGVREHKDGEAPIPTGTLNNIRIAFRTAWRNRNYRRLVTISLLFGMAITLFPHYQSLGRGRLELGYGQLVPWLIAQNIGVTLFSIPVGWVADRLGNRLAMRGLLLALSLTPLLALVMSRFPNLGPPGFWLVFLMLGLFPITIRVLSNYALEIAPHDDQANYLSVVNLAMAMPAIVFAPLVGWAIDLWGFEPAFILVDVLVVLAFLLSPTLDEPRHQLTTPPAGFWKDSDTEA